MTTTTTNAMVKFPCFDSPDFPTLELPMTTTLSLFKFVIFQLPDRRSLQGWLHSSPAGCADSGGFWGPFRCQCIGMSFAETFGLHMGGASFFEMSVCCTFQCWIFQNLNLYSHYGNNNKLTKREKIKTKKWLVPQKRNNQTRQEIVY